MLALETTDTVMGSTVKSKADILGAFLDNRGHDILHALLGGSDEEEEPDNEQPSKTKRKKSGSKAKGKAKGKGKATGQSQPESKVEIVVPKSTKKTKPPTIPTSSTPGPSSQLGQILISAPALSFVATKTRQLSVPPPLLPSSEYKTTTRNPKVS